MISCSWYTDLLRRVRAEDSFARYFWAAAAVLICLLPLQVRAEYRIGPGDVIELSVAGAPDLRQRSTVDLSGEVTLPLLGSLKVAGLSLSEMRARVAGFGPTKTLRRRDSQGRESVYAVGPEEILLTIAEYRPIYISGDVSSPGEKSYRPSMTVRQAIAVAGGYDIARFRMNNPYLEAAELRSQYEVLWTEFAKEQAHIARLEAELKGENNIEAGQISETPASERITARIRDLEADLLKTRDADFAKEKSYLASAIKQAHARLSFLNEQLEKEKEGVALDAAELERATALYDKGQGTITRVSDARRSLLLSSTRQLQTVAQATQVELFREELQRKLQKIDDARRIEITRELGGAIVRLSSIRSRLQAVTEKVHYVATVRSELVRGSGGLPEVVVIRHRDQTVERITATEDTQLMPGDTVQVALNLPEVLVP